jgi:hypothetical protein
MHADADAIDRLVDRLEEKCRKAFFVAVKRAEDDLEALLDGLEADIDITDEDQLDALDEDQLDEALDDVLFNVERTLTPIITQAFTDLEAQLDGGFVDAAILAALALSLSFTINATAALEARKALTGSTINTIVADTLQAIIGRLSATTKGAAATVRYLRDSIGLTPAQARSLAAYRAALNTALAQQKPTTTRPGFSPRSTTTTPTVTLTQTTLRTLTAAQCNAVKAAIARGDLTPAKIDAMIRRHREALLKARADAIATTEAVRATNAGELAAWQQAADRGDLNPDTTRRFWRDVGDERVRANHRAVSKMNPKGMRLNEPFKTPLGPCMYPPLEIRCRCRVILKAADHA